MLYVCGLDLARPKFFASLAPYLLGSTANVTYFTHAVLTHLFMVRGGLLVVSRLFGELSCHVIIYTIAAGKTTTPLSDVRPGREPEPTGTTASRSPA